MALDPARAATRYAVRRIIADSPVVVACSGGADSLALLAATVFEGARSRAMVIGAVVDHGLQDDSAAHTDRVITQMAEIGADQTASVRVRVDGPGGLEAAAREARYAALGEVAQRLGAGTVLLGHTRDDQAETVLLGLTRGSGGRSIAGMRPSYDEDGIVFARPFLDITRATTEAACRADGIEFWSDPHNADPRFTRSRIRTTVLPMLEDELGPGVAAALARTGDLLRPDMELLDELGDELAANAVATSPDPDLAILAAAPAPLRTRALRRILIEAGVPGSELNRGHLDQVDRQLVIGPAGGREVQLPGPFSLTRGGDRLVISPGSRTEEEDAG